MNISRDKLSKVFENLNTKELHKEAGIYILHGQVIDINKIKSIEELVYYSFQAGMEYKITQVKDVLNISDPRI